MMLNQVCRFGIICILWVTILGCNKEEVAITPTPLTDITIPLYFGNFKVPADNPLTIEGVELGRMLFYETKLSGNSAISCGSCHQQEHAFAENKALTAGITDKELTRNTMHLANLMWGPPRFFWDGRAKSLEDQALQPIENPDEMGESIEHVIQKLAETTDYPEMFKAAFGSPQITSDRIAKAIASFERTLISSNSKYDKYLKGELELTEQELWGKDLFITHPDAKAGIRGANCVDCHSQFLTSGFGTSFDGFANNGLDYEADLELGLAAVTNQTYDKGKFKVPSLRNVAITAPYMHDGRFLTLEEVLDHYNEHVKLSSTLDPLIREASNELRFPQDPIKLYLTIEEKNALIAFLNTLTDQEFINNEKFSDPH